MIYKNNDIEINYEISGTGINILMIHGFAVDHQLMKGCMENLLPKDVYRSIYIDLPGMGKSNTPESINSSDDILNVLIEFINDILSNEKIIIIGESYGGYIARGIHSILKDQIIGLGLICPAIYADRNKRTLPEHEIIIQDIEFLKKLTDDQKENFSLYNVILTQDVFNRYQQEIMTGINISNKKFLSKIESKYAFSNDIDKHDKIINIPTVIITGKQDSIVGYQDAYSIVKNYKRATYFVLDGAGHNLQIEQPEIFDVIMNNWLKKIV